MRSFNIVIADSGELYDSFNEVLLSRPDGNLFALYDETALGAIEPDLLLESLDEHKRRPIYDRHLAPRMVLAAKCAPNQVNYILNELIYRRDYYPRIVVTDQGDTITQGDIRTITRVRRKMVLDTRKGRYTISDPHGMHPLLASPIFYPLSDRILISHQDMDYRQLDDMLTLTYDHVCPDQPKYRRTHTRSIFADGYLPAWAKVRIAKRRRKH